jgi:hypothetical protein
MPALFAAELLVSSSNVKYFPIVLNLYQLYLQLDVLQIKIGSLPN